MAKTVIFLLEATYILEARQKGSANCHKIVAPPQNRSAPLCVLALGTTNLTEPIHQYRHDMYWSRSQWQSRQPGLLLILCGLARVVHTIRPPPPPPPQTHTHQ